MKFTQVTPPSKIKLPGKITWVKITMWCKANTIKRTTVKQVKRSTLQHGKQSKKKEKTDTTNGRIIKSYSCKDHAQKRRSVNDSRAHRRHNAQGQNTPAEICKKLRLRNGHRKPQWEQKKYNQYSQRQGIIYSKLIVKQNKAQTTKKKYNSRNSTARKTVLKNATKQRHQLSSKRNN